MKGTRESKARGKELRVKDARGFYDSLGDDYDLMVSWESRLAREQAFFAPLFDVHGVKSVLDAACGTGMHAIAFARQGRQAAGADISPAMIDKATQNAAQAGVPVDFRVAGFGRMAETFGDRFDAVTCLGNSLPHLLEDGALEAALADFAGVLRPGGLLVLQNRNYDRALEKAGPSVHLNARPEADGETLFVRMTEPRGGESIDFSILTLRKRGGSWTSSLETTPLRAITRERMQRAVAAAGFGGVEAWGDYSRAAYGAPGTGDLLVIARLGGPAGSS
jgi:glycine/sarcosine N-methyltransferase